MGMSDYRAEPTTVQVPHGNMASWTCSGHDVSQIWQQEKRDERIEVKRREGKTPTSSQEKAIKE